GKGKGKRKPAPHEKSSGPKTGDLDDDARDAFAAAKKNKSPPDSPKAGRKRDAKKWRMDNWNVDDDESGGREELHALRRRERKKNPARVRKVGSVSTSMTHQHGFEKPTAPVIHEVIIPEVITVGDLAQAMSVKSGEVVKQLFQMGMMVTVNQILDQDTAILLVEEMGHVAKPAVDEDVETVLKNEMDEIDTVTTRPPIVTVMGHVDHGKTSLLDYLRKTRVVAGEAGGITQHIGAYRIGINDQEICFLDTPGHEAFSAMRARGTKATDLVILVVAADDGVKPQTVEAINHAKSAEVPIIVAINKIDREEADSERVKQELSNHELIPEEWGGETLMNEVSALTGQGIDALLESVMVQAELCDLKAKPTGKASGLVIEARLDKGKGPVATLLVKEGLLQRGNFLLAGEQTGKIRVLSDDQGQQINQAGPSTPVEVQGLERVPVAGDDFMVVADERVAREIASSRQGKSKERKTAQQQKTMMDSIFNRMEEGDAKTLNILIKADVQGSVEALKESLNKLSGDEVQIKVVHGLVGGINESDINLAKAVESVIVGFNVRADATARKLIDAEGIKVFYHNIIYDVVDTIKACMTGLMDEIAGEEHVGLVEVRDVFRSPKIGAVAGCYVTKGTVKRNLPVRVLRDNIVIFEGAIDSLRRFKDDVSEVKHGYECGIGIKDYNDVKVGDQIEIYQVVHSAPTL
ncbi:MAG: translation initiation factor IF-2, partial [Gammaproteobacteria bacterium]|nr:translation initiation factor IF-2 [Gammaproteobacteria bacterium]